MRMNRASLFVLTLTTLAASTGTATAQSSLIGWWTLDETSGTTAADSSGNGNNGTLVNMAGIDRLGLTNGQDYEMRLFYANRNSSKEFRFRTNVFLTSGGLLGSPSGFND